MDKKLKKRLLDALKKAGLSEALVSTLEGQDNEKIEEFISGLSPSSKPPTAEEFIQSEAFNNFLQSGGFNKLGELNTSFQSELDKKLGKAVYTFKKNMLEQDGNHEGGGKSKGGDDDLAKLLGGQITPELKDNPIVGLLQGLVQEVQGLKAERKTESKLDQAKAVIAKTDLPDTLKTKWLGRIDLDSEKSFEDQANELVTEFQEFFGDGSASTGGQQHQDGSSYSFQQNTKKKGELSKADEAEIAKMAENMNV